MNQIVLTEAAVAAMVRQAREAHEKSLLVTPDPDRLLEHIHRAQAVGERDATIRAIAMACTGGHFAAGYTYAYNLVFSGIQSAAPHETIAWAVMELCTTASQR